MALRYAIVALLLAALSANTFNTPCVAQEVKSPLTQAELFDDQRLLDIQIEIADEDWKKLGSQSVDFVSAFSKGPVESSYTYFPGNITINGRRLEKVELRKKGFFGSTDSVRPSLKIRIENSDQAELIGGLEKLTLNNNKQDRANASQILAYKLFQKAGLPSPRCCLAKVTVNGQPLGIYTHVESIDESFLMRTFESDTGNLYEGVFPTDFLLDRLERFEFKSGKQKKDRSDLQRICELAENPPADFAKRLDELVDVEQFITYWALESLIAFWDGYAANQNNFYLYQDPRDSKFHFIPWGADMTLSPPFFPTGGSKSVYAKGLLAYHLNQDPEVRQRYHAAQLNLLEKVWDEDELLAEVDRIETLVRDHLHPAQGDIKQSCETTRTFIKNRRREIMDEIKDGPVHITTPPAKPMYMREAGEVLATFSAEWTPLDEKEPKPSEQATMELKVDGEPVKLEGIVANAGPARFPNFGQGPQGPPPPTIVLSGMRESDQKKITLTIIFNGDQFQETADEAVSVQGMLIEGEMFMIGGGMRSFVGKADLKSAGQQSGAVVAGELSGKLYEMRGFFGRQ